MDKKRFALFNHGECGSKFFTEPNDNKAQAYEGPCPNPRCNRQVTLFPEELFHSIDNARRAYIKRARKSNDVVYWRA